MKTLQKTAALIAVVASIGMTTGCGDQELTIGVADSTFTVTGRVINAMTRDPIAGAEITMWVNGVAMTTTSKESVVTPATKPMMKIAADFGPGGFFSLSGLPAGSHSMTVTATGMATIQTTASLGGSDDNTPLTTNFGNMGMGPSHDLSVVVTQDGTVVSGAPVVAMSSGTSATCNSALFTYTATPEITVDSGTDGIALLTGLNACSTYNIYVPARSDADGNLLTTTQAKAYTANIDSQESVFSMDLMPVERAVAPSKVTDSFLDMTGTNIALRTATDTNASGGNQQTPDSFNSTMAMKTTGNNYVVFNMPVAIADTGGFRMSTNQYLTNPDVVDNGTEATPADGLVDATYGDDAIVAATFSLDTTGTILTIAPPSSGYIANQVYMITGSVYAMNNGSVDTLSVDMEIMATEDGTTGLTATSAMTLDNYNGNTGLASGSASMTAGTTWLEFSEPVTGMYRLISAVDMNQTAATTDDTTTLINGSEVAISYASGALIYSDGTDTTTVAAGQSPCNQCGTTAGIKYIVPITGLGANSEDGDVVTLFVDVVDVEGNRFSDEITLTIE